MSRLHHSRCLFLSLRSLFFCVSLSHSFVLSFTSTHTHTHSESLSVSLYLCFLPHCRSLSLSLCISHTLRVSLSFIVSLSHSLSQSESLILSFTKTHSELSPFPSFSVPHFRSLSYTDSQYFSLSPLF